MPCPPENSSLDFTSFELVPRRKHQPLRGLFAELVQPIVLEEAASFRGVVLAHYLATLWEDFSPLKENTVIAPRIHRSDRAAPQLERRLERAPRLERRHLLQTETKFG